MLNLVLSATSISSIVHFVLSNIWTEEKKNVNFYYSNLSTLFIHLMR